MKSRDLENRTTITDKLFFPNYAPIQRLLIILIGYFSIVQFAFPQTYLKNTTRKMYQITGDFDRPLRRKTKSLTETNAGVVGTDLGSSFEHKGKLYFLFGDTVGPSIGGRDSFAFTSSNDPSSMTLTFPLDVEGDFQQIVIPGVGTGGMRVPSGGISYKNAIYIIHTTQWYATDGNMEKSVMAVSNDDGITWTKLYDFSVVGTDHDMTNTHFINVSMSIVDSSEWPDLPYTGENLVIFGSGAYRKSNVYLAAMPAGSIASKSTLRYLGGFNEGIPVWTSEESSSLALFNHPAVGEFSCYWISQLGKWVMLYNASSPRGITMRTADYPWGPWSSGTIIMEPWGDGGYARFMHVSWSEWGYYDAFHDGLMGGANVWGGEYGPYLIPRFTSGDSSSCQLYYTMSTWNPYQVILMRSEVGAPVPSPPGVSVTTILLPGDSGWTKTPGTWFVNFTHNLTPWIGTNATGNSDQGIMFQWLPRDMWNKSLSFSVHGGNAEVLLIEGGGEIPTTGDFTAIYDDIKKGSYGDVIQCTWGHEDNDIDVPVNWNLLPFDRANLKIVIIDHLVDSWGFVAASQMTLTRNEPEIKINSWLFY